MRRLVSYLETRGFSGRFLPEDFDACYGGRRGTFATEGDHRVNVRFLSLKDGFDPAVTTIPYPPCNAVSVSYSPSFISEEDALDESPNEDMGPNSQVSRICWRKFDTPYVFLLYVRASHTYRMLSIG